MNNESTFHFPRRKNDNLQMSTPQKNNAPFEYITPDDAREVPSQDRETHRNREFREQSPVSTAISTFDGKKIKLLRLRDQWTRSIASRCGNGHHILRIADAEDLQMRVSTELCF